MKNIVTALMIIALLAAPALAGPVTQKDFLVQTTQQLISLCTAAKDDPLHNHARNFCHGYLVGAFHYYLEAHDNPKAGKLVCFSKKRPSRNQAVKMFVDWAKAHPQYMGERPVETEFRFLMATWPCHSQAAR